MGYQQVRKKKKHYMSPKGKEKEKGMEKIFEEIMVKNNPNMMKDLKLQI